MKKITSLALALALALTLTACGKKDNTAGSGDSSVPADATALLTAVWDAHSDDEKFPAAGGDNSAVEMTCEELERYSSNFTAWVDVCKGWRNEEA